jgi:hypothetical protein
VDYNLRFSIIIPFMVENREETATPGGKGKESELGNRTLPFVFSTINIADTHSLR